MIGKEAINPRAVARIVQTRGAMTTGVDQSIHPTKLKRLGRHKSYAVMDEHLEVGDASEGYPLAGVL